MKKFYPFVLLLLLILSSGKSFSQLYEVSLDEKISGSPLIVEGKVVEQTCFWDPTHSLIFTANKVKVYKVFRGNVSTEFVEIMTKGGTVGDEYVGVTHQLELEKDLTGIFFCYPNATDLRSPVTNKRLLDVYSSTQGFFQYDMLKQEAGAPFVRYSSITNQLYPELQQKLGRSYEIKDPSFNVTSYAAPTTRNPTAPVITSFSPAAVNAGKLADPSTNLLIITGTGFGAPGGSAAVQFDDANNGTGGTVYPIASTNSNVLSWTDTEIQIRVPSRAGTGFFNVVDASGVSVTSPTALTVNYSILNLTFGTAPTERMFNMMNANGLGGLNYLYSTSTAGSGVDFSTAPQEPPFNRAITTWKEVCGLNYTYAGTTTSQNISVGSSNFENIIVMDNTNVGPGGVLPSGVLASCWYSGNACSGVINARSLGFDIQIRNSGVSGGSTLFNNGPCRTTTSTTPSGTYDMEAVLLHELGHSFGLGHINDSYIGPYPNVDPGKLMNFAIVNGVDRRSPDWSAYTGALYMINPRGNTYGACTAATEMIPLTTTTESKDNCPVTFPPVATVTGTLATFDLNHATSDKTVDPQYTAVTCTGTGVGITNNAYLAIRTNSAGTLILTVGGYATTPAAQAACSNAGVELALYQTASCPTAQAYPTPVACRTFNADGALATFAGLLANTNYLIMVDGMGNTKANFSFTLSGTALASAVPLRITSFTGNAGNGKNFLNWKMEYISGVDKVTLEAATDGVTFTELYSRAPAGLTTLNDAYTDNLAAPVKYYRLKIYNRSGVVEYSNIVVLRQNGKQGLSVSPNPAGDVVTISFYKPENGTTVFRLVDMSGKTVAEEKQFLNAGGQSIQSGILRGQAPGNYILRISNGGNTWENVMIQKKAN